MNRINLIILLHVLLSQIVYSQTIDKNKLDTYFQVLEENNKFMGSVAVSKHGNIIYTKSVGFADLENQIKTNENTIYRIGSISKTFTAVLVMKAIEEGKLKLNQTIKDFFPSLPHADKITIEHLLTHRSGIHNFTNDSSYLTYNTQPKNEGEMLKIIGKAGSDFEPGFQSSYSNSNYVLLTFIVESVFDSSYKNLLSHYITKPLGLKQTYFGGKINPRKSESKSYTFDESWKISSETDTSIPLGAGGIVSTSTDLVKFSDALFGGKVLKTESLEKMKQMKGFFGMGLIQVPFYDKLGYGHTGGIDGFRSVLFHFEDENVSFAMTSNAASYDINNISISVLSAVYNKDYEIPAFNSIELSSEDLDTYVGVYSSTMLPLKITITKENNSLIAQATGQSSFILEAFDKDKFRFDQAGLILEFTPSEKTMLLKQGGGEFLFQKE